MKACGKILGRIMDDLIHGMIQALGSYITNKMLRKIDDEIDRQNKEKHRIGF